MAISSESIKTDITRGLYRPSSGTTSPAARVSSINMARETIPHDNKAYMRVTYETSLQSLDTTVCCPFSSDTLHRSSATGYKEEQLLESFPIRKPDYSFRRVLLNWWTELASMALSGFLCLPVIVGTLRSYDGRPLADWSLPVTLNAIVALISTICRMTFIYPLVQALAQQRWNWYKRPRSLDDFRVFDEAPGGIWGSLSLLVMMRRSPLGVITCLILITSTMTSTLTQSVVSYADHAVAAGGNDSAVIVKSNGYHPEKNADSTNDLALELQLLSSLSIPPGQNFPSQRPSCKTANCTWPEFGTMEVCVNMTDVTTFLESSRALSNGVGWDPNHTGDFAVTAGVTSNLFRSSAPNFHSLSFNDTDGQKAEIISFYILDGGLNIAYEIMLHYCINRYIVSMVGNIPMTKLVSSASSSDFYYENLDLVRWLSDPKEPGSRYPISVWYQAFTLNKLEQLFLRKNDMGSEVAQMVSGWMHDARAKLLLQVSGPESYHYDTVHNISRNIAAELTKYLLSPNDGNLASVIGTAWQQEIRISVRWEWLSLIAAQVALSLIVLLAVIIQTSELGLPVVKSSILPAFLAVGLADRTAIEREHYGRCLTPAAAGMSDEEKNEGCNRKDHEAKKGTNTPEETYALLGELQRTKKGKWVLKSVYRED